MHDIGDILRESLAHETQSLTAYYALLELAQGKSVLLEDYARGLIVEEEMAWIRLIRCCGERVKQMYTKRQRVDLFQNRPCITSYCTRILALNCPIAPLRSV